MKKMITTMVLLVLAYASAIQAAVVNNVDLYAKLGMSGFSTQSSAGTTFTVLYQDSQVSPLAFNPGTEQRIHIQIPPGVVSAAIQQLTAGGAGFSGIYSVVYPAAGNGQPANIPDGFSYTKASNAPSGSLYSGSAVSTGSKTAGTLIMYNGRNSTFTFGSVRISYTLGSSSADLSAYNDWVNSGGSTTSTGTVIATGQTTASSAADEIGGTAPASTSTGSGSGSGTSLADIFNTSGGSSSDESLSFDGTTDSTGEGTGETGNTDEATASNTSGATASGNDVIKYVLQARLQSKNPNITVDDITIKNNKIWAKISDEKTLVLQYKPVDDLPASTSDVAIIKGLTKDSKVVGANTIRGINFKSQSTDKEYSIYFYPAPYDDGEAFKSFLLALNSVSYVTHTDDGWTIAILDNGAAYRIYYEDSATTGGAENSALGFDLPGDLNGDGVNDFTIKYQDGTTQNILFFTPSIVESYAKLQAQLNTDSSGDAEQNSSSN